MKRLRTETERVKEERREEYRKKLEHLRRKGEEKKKEDQNKIPESMEGFEELRVFDKETFEEIQINEEEVLCVSKDITLNEDEREILKLHPKFSIIKVLQRMTSALNKK